MSNKINADCPECGAVVFRYVPPMRPMWVRCWGQGDHPTLSHEPTTDGWHRLDLLADSTLGTEFDWDAVPPNEPEVTNA